MRPHGGFGLRPELLPSLHPSPDSPTKAFPALSDPRLGLYAVVDSADWVERVLAAGVRTVQLRIKEGARAHLSREVSRSVLAAHRARAQLFINDHWELAIENRAYGVHLGQEDLRSADMDALRSAGLRVGLSTHSYWEVCRAHAWAPSYIACGPIHATTTKDMPWWPQGPGNLALGLDVTAFRAGPCGLQSDTGLAAQIVNRVDHDSGADRNQQNVGRDANITITGRWQPNL